MASICKDLQATCNYVHDWLTGHPNVKEESLTDWLLYEVDRRRTDIVYTAYSRHEEARNTGADWEWWIVFSDGAFRLRLQAKKINAAGNNYPSLAYTNQHGLQIDKLIADARNAKAFPMYAFYSHLHGSVRCPINQASPSGVHLASAHRVDDLLRSSSNRQVTAVDALSLATPLPCFFCCPLVRSRRSAATFSSYLAAYHLAGSPQSMPLQEVDGYHESVPAFVAVILENRGVPGWWEKEFSRELEDVQSLLVTDLRANNSFKPKPLRGSA